MKDRKTAIISGLVLAGLVLVGGWLKYGEKKKGEVKVEKYFGDQVESFCVNKICLIKKTDGWWMMGAEAEEPADGELAESMLKKIRDLESGEVVAKNSQRFENLGIGGNNQVFLEALGKKMEIGKISDDYDGTYVRTDGEEMVWLVKTVIDKNEVATKEYWQKKWLTNVSVYQITEVKIKIWGKERILTPKENKWPEEALVNNVAYLKAIKYLGNKEPSKIVAEIELKTEKETVSLKIGANWATVDGKNYFEISKEDVKQLTGARR